MGWPIPGIPDMGWPISRIPDLGWPILGFLDLGLAHLEKYLRKKRFFGMFFTSLALLLASNTHSLW